MSTDAMRRVDHAGEWGAVHIYKGQCWIMPGDTDTQHMLKQEQNHLDAFTEQIVKYGVRPSWLQPVWAAGGFALGAITALMGRKMAHTCTVAVENIIIQHYQDQLKTLYECGEEELICLIQKCMAEEVEHMHLSEDAVGDVMPYPISAALIRGVTRVAIAVAKRI